MENNNHKEKYESLIEAIKILRDTNPSDSGIQNWIKDFVPELAESKDEKTRKRIIALVNAHGQGMYKDDMLAWLENIPYTIDHEKREGFHLGYKAGLEKQGEQKPIINVPPREVILAIWDLGNEWKELTNGSISTEYGTQLDYIQKHWHESEYYLREKQGEQKPTDKDMVEALRTEYEKGRADVIADTISWLENCWPRYCSNQTIIKGFKEAIKGE